MTRPRPAAADALVGHVASAAASLPERAGVRWLVARETPARVVQERLQRWRQQAAGGQQAAFEKLCRARGIADPRTWVSDVAAAPGASLPGWARQLRAFLEGADRPADRDRQALAGHTASGTLPVAGVGPVAVPVGAGAEALAPAVMLLRNALRASRAPSRALADDLCRHFAGLLLTTFADLLIRGALDGGPDAAGSWIDVLHEYPAAGRCLGSLLEGYLGYATELSRRLDADAPALGVLADLRDGATPRATGCRPGAGDRHNGSRSVTIVEFLGGPRVVYKPRDLRHVDALARIADASGTSLPLPRRLVRPGYGWEEFVEAAEPATVRQRRNAARELGAWTFLFQLLGASDILADNVRISADRVVPVDVETLFRFSFVDPSGLSWLPPAATGLFSLPLLREAQGRVPDVGLMAGPGAVFLDHAEDLVAGYASAAARAAKRKTPLAEQIMRAGDAPVRAIVRSTWVYEGLLVRSLRAEALTDGITRDLALERLWLSHLRAGLPAPLVAAEIAAIRRLDVPMFECSAGGTQIRAAEPDARAELAGPAAALFEPPLASALARAAALRQADDAELDGLRAAMFCAAENGRGPRAAPASGSPVAGREPAGRGRSAPDWAERAVSAAVQSASWLRSGGPGGAPLTAGLLYVSRNDAILLGGERPFDLFSGLAGMAVALTSLAQLSGDGTIGEAGAAVRAEAEAAGRLLADDECRRAEAGRPTRMAGAYGGLAALAAVASSAGAGLEALRRCLEALAGQDLSQAALVPQGIESLGGLAAALCSATAAQVPDTAVARDQATGALRAVADRAAGSARFSSGLGRLVPSERALATWALGRAGESVPANWAPARGPAPDGTAVPGSGDRLVAAALDPVVLQPTAPSALRGLDTLSVLAELEVSLVGLRRNSSFAAAAVAAGDILLARYDATSRWFGDSLAPDRFRLSAVWGTIAVAYLLMGLADPAAFSSLRLFEPVISMA